MNADCREHERASAYLTEAAGDASFAICELVLMELYVLLRNPAVVRSPLSAREAVDVVLQYRRNPRWAVIDYPGGLMTEIWSRASAVSFPRRAVIDARLAYTLRHHGVREFATRNTRDFEGYGFERLVNPLAD